MTPIIYTDYYKTEHFRMYPDHTHLIYSNLTPRKSRIPGINSIVVFGIQHFIKKYLLGKFQQNFFDKSWEEVDAEYKYAINVNTEHIRKLHKLGYLPLEIRALPEGMRCPIRVPCVVMWNTVPEFYWLTNYLETLMSCQLWQPMTSATIAAEYWKILSKYAEETSDAKDFVQWQAHDFSMRGMSSLESAILSGMAHLTSFTGTDTIPAIYALRNSYGAKGLIGASVPATEHSVMCMGTMEDEIGTFKRLLDLYPTGILSVVSDTWDLWKVCLEILPALKEQIMGRDGKLVIRPDSGNPVDIICGVGTRGEYDHDSWVNYGHNTRVGKEHKEASWKGVIEILWDTFGGKVNSKGYKELDIHVGAIYGDSITMDRAKEICEKLKKKGFASTNIVFGIGSYTYQMNTRDTFGFAMKATYGELVDWKKTELIAHGPGVSEWDMAYEAREIFKDPITDDGTKKSAKGLLFVGQRDGEIYLKDQATWDEVRSPDNLLQPVFRDGELLKEWTLDEIRDRIKAA
jgi:nicotinamide phosphoribosyltransferase